MGRVADFLEFGELMCRDALTRKSCRSTSEEHQTDDGEALRDMRIIHVAVWEHQNNKEPKTSRKIKV